MNAILLVAVVAFMRPGVALMGLIWLMGGGNPLHAASAGATCVAAPHADARGTGRPDGDAGLAQAGAQFCDRDVLGLVVSLFILAILNCSRTPKSEAYIQLSHALSRSSYTLYLVHMPFLVLLAAWIGEARRHPVREVFWRVQASFCWSCCTRNSCGSPLRNAPIPSAQGSSRLSFGLSALKSENLLTLEQTGRPNAYSALPEVGVNVKARPRGEQQN